MVLYYSTEMVPFFGSFVHFRPHFEAFFAIFGAQNDDFFMIHGGIFEKWLKEISLYISRRGEKTNI